MQPPFWTFYHVDLKEGKTKCVNYPDNMSSSDYSH